MQALLMGPLMLLNAFGGIAAGIWLLTLKEWGAIWYGIAALLFSHYLLGFAVMPGALFAVPGMALAEKGRFLLALPFMGSESTLHLCYHFCLVHLRHVSVPLERA
jgi:hypothetical protein